MCMKSCSSNRWIIPDAERAITFPRQSTWSIWATAAWPRKTHPPLLVSCDDTPSPGSWRGPRSPPAPSRTGLWCRENSGSPGSSRCTQAAGDPWFRPAFSLTRSLVPAASCASPPTACLRRALTAIRHRMAQTVAEKVFRRHTRQLERSQQLHKYAREAHVTVLAKYNILARSESFGAKVNSLQRCTQ